MFENVFNGLDGSQGNFVIRFPGALQQYTKCTRRFRRGLEE